MELWVLLLGTALVLLQLFIDTVFVFIVYMTGVVILNLITLFNKHYMFLSYSAFKKAHKTKALSKRPYQVGCVAWLFVFVVVFLISAVF